MLHKREFPASLNSLPDMLEAVRRQIDKYVEDEKQKKRLELCAEEILANIIQYAYPGAQGSLFISIEHMPDKNKIQFTFADSGVPYNPLAGAGAKEKKKITTLKEQPIGGLGIFLYVAIMDGASYERRGGMNYLSVWKNL